MKSNNILGNILHNILCNNLGNMVCNLLGNTLPAKNCLNHLKCITTT